MTNLDPLLERNRAFATTGAHTGLSMMPNQPIFVVTCLDPRVDPAAFLGVGLGDAPVVRNAGGRITDAVIDDIAFISYLAGTILGDGPLFEVAVIHHTNCGMEFFTDDVMRDLLASSLETAELGAQGFRDVGKGPGSAEGQFIDWLTIKDAKQAVVDDVTRIRRHALVPKKIPIYGYIYDVKTGRLVEVEEATRAGRVDESTRARRVDEVEVPTQESPLTT